MVRSRTDDSEVGFVKEKPRAAFGVEVSHWIISSSPVEKHQAASHSSSGCFGVAVPTTFSVLDANIERNDQSLSNAAA